MSQQEEEDLVGTSGRDSSSLFLESLAGVTLGDLLLVLQLATLLALWAYLTVNWVLGKKRKRPGGECVVYVVCVLAGFLRNFWASSFMIKSIR